MFCAVLCVTCGYMTSTMDHKSEFQVKKERKLAKKKWKEEKVLKFLNKAHTDSTKDSEGEIKKFKPDDNAHVQDVYKQSGTVSIAVPGSILENAQSFELRTYLAGQIARAACIYKIDEIVVFDDLEEETYEGSSNNKEARHCCVQLARILQYLECPQYLRKQLFPLHKDLQFAGILNPLDAPHHLRQNDVSLYREGIVVNRPVKRGGSSLVNVGLGKDIAIDHVIQPGTRVTIKLDKCGDSSEDGKLEGINGRLTGKVVPPWQPKAHVDIYWGYQVRIASSLSEVLSQCPFSSGEYDLTIGTSDRGSVDIPSQLPAARHVLILFGGLQGLEAALECNGGVLGNKVGSDASLLFDHYFNTCPGQGSRTIRTEEALLISLCVLTPRIVFSKQ